MHKLEWLLSLGVRAEKGQRYVSFLQRPCNTLDLLHIYNYLVMCHINRICENKVLAISKNSLGCSVYFYSFLLVQYLQVCFKRGMRQETRMSDLYTGCAFTTRTWSHRVWGLQAELGAGDRVWWQSQKDWGDEPRAPSFQGPSREPN